MLAQICYAQNKQQVKKAELLETIPIKLYTGGVIVIEAKLNNITTKLNFLLDTGSGGISLDSATCEEFNITLRKTDTLVSGIGGTKNVSYAFNQTLTTGTLKTDSLNFYVNDYSLLSSVYGEKIDGIIGYSFLSRYILDINFDSSYIQIYSPGKFKYEDGGTMFNPTFTRLIAHNVGLKDKIKLNTNLYFDSGAGLCLLLTESFLKDNNLLLSRRKPVVTQVQGLGGKKPMRLTVIKRLQLGPYIFRNVPTDLYNDEENITSYPYTSGLLGNDILRRFNMTLNYLAREIYLKPNSNFDAPFDYAYTGMTLYYYDKKIIIDDIVPKSPAEKAGLKNGDEIVCVANNCSGNVQTYENIIQKARETIRLIVSRNDKAIFISLFPISIR
jgi:Aspartyl protease/PDZ domain